MRCLTHRLKPLQCGLLILTFCHPFVKYFLLIFLTFFQVVKNPFSIGTAAFFHAASPAFPRIPGQCLKNILKFFEKSA